MYTSWPRNDRQNEYSRQLFPISFVFIIRQTCKHERCCARFVARYAETRRGEHTVHNDAVYSYEVKIIVVRSRLAWIPSRSASCLLLLLLLLLRREICTALERVSSRVRFSLERKKKKKPVLDEFRLRSLSSYECRLHFLWVCLRR